jgi:L-iditol 2-dehydrogenase
MRAAVFRAPHRIECATVPVPSPANGELLLETVVATICGSDLHAFRNGTGVTHFPAAAGYPGHEAVGRVVESTAPEFAVGTLALLVPDGSCNRAFADYQVVSTQFAIPLPHDVDPTTVVIAQQLGTVIFSLKRLCALGAPVTATVIGAGPAGLMFIECLRDAGCQRIIASDLSAFRLDEARHRGAVVTVDAACESVVDATRDATNGAGAELVVEAAGHDRSRADAIGCVAINGTVGFFGLPEHSGDAPLPLELMFARRPTIHVTNTAQHEAYLASFRAAIDEVVHRGIAHGLVSHTMPLDEIGQAFRLAAEPPPGVLKVGITWQAALSKL